MKTAGLLLLALIGLATGEGGNNATEQCAKPCEGPCTHETIKKVAWQLAMLQLFVEERIRSEGGSGIKQMRVNGLGTRPYYSATQSARSAAAMHNHANYPGTIGLGEFIAVMNGVEFRTRHNDYKLVMPSTNSSDYHATEPIPFPEVPPEVMKLITVEAQIEEMKLWFKAFRDQDYSVRDYRKYFKPVLCYLEGHWTLVGDEVDESFISERHAIDAESWKELARKVRYTSYSGTKSNLENFAFLPTIILDVINCMPTFAQWNYRLLCHPLKDDLPLKNFRAIDDLATRMMNKQTMEEYVKSRAARFQVIDASIFKEGKLKHSPMDDFMGQVPGVDNYQGDLYDEGFGMPAFDINNRDKKLNAAYYNRQYVASKKGASGLQDRRRGFSENAYFAITSNPRVPEVGYTFRKGQTYETFSQRWSYAIPLEVVYLTPLSNWNPYGIVFKGRDNSDAGKWVKEGGKRNGKTHEKAYNGSSTSMYARTPRVFFVGEDAIDAADTETKPVYVLDGDNKVRDVVTSGQRIHVNIADVGKLRTRWPVFSVAGEGGSLWKQFTALQDVVLYPKTYSHMYHEHVEMETNGNSVIVDEGSITGATFNMEPANDHTHVVEFTSEQMKTLILGGEEVTTESSEAQGHRHEVTAWYNAKKNKFLVKRCDGKKKCEHTRNKNNLNRVI